VPALALALAAASGLIELVGITDAIPNGVKGCSSAQPRHPLVENPSA
jgi:hypothetical protein